MPTFASVRHLVKHTQQKESATSVRHCVTCMRHTKSSSSTSSLSLVGRAASPQYPLDLK